MSDEIEREEQPALFEMPAEWERHWEGMPEFSSRDERPFDSIRVHFRSAEDRRAFLALLEENPARRRSIWYPKMPIQKMSIPHEAGMRAPEGRYPIYIISKGRADTRLTSKALELLGLPYLIVVEPQEHAQYAEHIDPSKILPTPFSNLGQGSIPARNFVWEHAISQGHARHWILDDNIEGFYRLNNNQKTKCRTESPFIAVEDFTDRYENIALSGLQYELFAPRREKHTAFKTNTRIYSCILINNSIPHRWRGRYNEDTDLSIRVLKDGWCTVLFYAYTCNKAPTMTMKGGNTDELYNGNGRLLMAQSLADQHPDIVTVTQKWGRYQHHVDYRPFRNNQLKLREDGGSLCSPAAKHYVDHLPTEEERCAPSTSMRSDPSRRHSPWKSPKS